jgi:hypothetical protein
MEERPFRNVADHGTGRVPTSEDILVVKPHYMKLHAPDHFAAVVATATSMSVEEVDHLLRLQEWRSRSTAAYLAAVCGYVNLEDAIGRLLLRSDLVYAGRSYAMALASFGSPSAVAFLERYLEVYLRRPDLWFDQGDVLAALSWVDLQDGQNRHSRWAALWTDFVADKPHWSLKGFEGRFGVDMELLIRGRTALRAR